MSLKFTNQQEQIINHLEGPLIVLAGAGVGKTFVICERILKLISIGVKHDSILALTFTNKAAAEMEERVSTRLDYTSIFPAISTFHSFADECLRKYGYLIKISSDYTLLTNSSSLHLLNSHLYKLGLDEFIPTTNSFSFAQELLTHFSSLREEQISPFEYREFVKVSTHMEPEKREVYLKLAAAYEKYEKVKLEHNQLDFADVVYFMNSILCKYPFVANEISSQYRYIFADEFQDTNYGQLLFLEKILTEHQNLMIVGDDDQSIYQFRGANVLNTVDFINKFPNSKIISLTDNFRNEPQILDASYNLIQNNNPFRLESKLGISKKLTSNVKQSGEISIVNTDNDLEEARQIRLQIQSLINMGYAYSEIAILTRAKSHSLTVEKELAFYNIPFETSNNSSLLNTDIGIFLICMLRFIVNPTSSLDFYKILTFEYFKIDSNTITELMRLHRFEHLSIDQALILVSETDSNTKYFYELISQFQNSYQKLTVGSFAFSVLEKTGLYAKMQSDFDTFESDIIQVTKLFEHIKRFEQTNKIGSLKDFLNYFDMLETSRDSESENGEYLKNAVSILTIHASKGLEFPIVFMPSLTQSRMPTRNLHAKFEIPDELKKSSIDEGGHINEERRLMYVAMTRAKSRLYLSWANVYADGKKTQKPSVFISEALGENLNINKKSSFSENSLFDLLVDFKKPPEKILIKEPVSVTSLSSSSIESFKTCPKQYKFQSINFVSGESSPALSFGKTMHACLEQIYTDRLQVYDQNYIEDLITSKFISDGYDSLEQIESKKLEANKYLSNYIRTHLEVKDITLNLEMKFKIQVGEFKLTGAIDRIARQPNGNILVVDYKTSKPYSQSELDSDIQLSIYAFAISKMPEFAVDVDKIVLSHFYFRTNEYSYTKRTKQQLQEMLEEATNVRNDILTSDFKAIVARHCEYCPFNRICEDYKLRNS